MVSCLVLAVVLLTSPAGPGAELAVNGSFDEPAADDNGPKGWALSGSARWLQENGNHFIRVQNNGAASQTIELQPQWWKIEVSVRVRCRNVVRGKESWHDARVAMMFADERGKRVGEWPNVMCWTGTFDWKRESRTFVIPQGAKRLQLSCAMYNATGTVDYDDLSVRLIALRPKPEDAKPPVPATTLWDVSRAWRRESKTRGKICINGLWQFYLGPGDGSRPPADGSGWGWIKVPGSWRPGSGIEPIGPDIWEARDDLGPTTTLKAWYRRRVKIPAQWNGRLMFINIDNPVRFATVFVNGQRVGQVSWPGGRLPIREVVQAGAEAEIAILVDATPIAASEWEKKSADERRQLARQVRLRGLCGDVFIESEPPEPSARFGDVLLMPSVRKKALRLRFSLPGARAAEYLLDAEARDQDGKVARRWRGVRVTPEMVRDGWVVAWLPWPNPRLWDVRRPYFYTLTLRLRDAGDGAVLDETLPIRFGFREFWVEGRKAFLNGHPVHLRAFDCLNTGSDGGLASEAACEWTLRRFAQLGMNFVYLGHYRLDWGQVRYLQGIIRAADRLGMLLALPMPHPAIFENNFDPATGKPEPEYWERMARWVARQAGNHPSVIMYAMSHNHLGHAGDQNPRYLDASLPEFDPRLPKNLLWYRRVAQWAERYVGSLDPTRPVYHHQCGNFGKWYTINCYLNWVPIQERIEWLSAFYHRGRKPLFPVEFGMPHRASFQRHRGAPFIWRNEVHAEPLCIEWAARLFGDAAYDLRPENIEQYDRMARVYERKGPKFYFWEVFNRSLNHGYLDVIGEYSRHTWPAFRTWELTAIGPWDWNDCGRVEAHRVEMPTDWTGLQRPGFVPDFIDVRHWYHQPPDQPVEWTAYGEALLRYNQDLLAYIAGRPEKFTSRDHIFRPGERVRKQIVLVNDAAIDKRFDVRWHADVGGKRIAGGRVSRTVGPGEVAKVPVSFVVPRAAADTAGRIVMEAVVDGRSGDNLRGTFAFQVIVPSPSQRHRRPARTVAIIDPVGTTSRQLRRLGIASLRDLGDGRRPSGPLPAAIIIGREALAADELELWRTNPDYAAEQGLPPRERLEKTRRLHAIPEWVGQAVSRGARVLVCEQTERVLTRTFGFRAAAIGVRKAFVRCPWHPVMRGISDELLSLWRGSSTLTVQRTLAGPVGTPKVDWLGFGNTRVWKWGSYGQVASAVIEKPHCGDFLALADCEFDLAYSPLIEYRYGRGSILFCQLDISERTENEPVVERLWHNIIEWLTAAPSQSNPQRRQVLYAGNDAGRRLLADLRVKVTGDSSVEALTARDLLVVGPGAAGTLGKARDKLASAVRDGAIVFCLAPKPEDISGWLPARVTLTRREIVWTPRPARDDWLLRGIGPSELHWRGRLKVWAVDKAPAGSITTATGLITGVPVGRGWVVICAATPDMFDADNPKRLYFRLSRQRCAQMLSRLLANCGADFDVPLVRSVTTPPAFRADLLKGRWLVKPDPGKIGQREKWFAPELDEAGWKPLAMPGFFDAALGKPQGYVGDVWLRCHFTIEDLPREEELKLVISAVDDEDWTYLNGRFIGHVGQDTNPEDYWSARREYKVQRQWLRRGENILAMRVRNLRGSGGIRRGPVAIVAQDKWLDSYYIDRPVATDDPYRYCRW